MTAKIIKTSDVFKTKGTPTHTYVSVSAGTYERQLRDAFEDKGTLCLITGPSKTGKTTLVSNVCATIGRKPLVVRCSNQTSADELWRKGLESVDFSRLAQQNNGKKTTAEIGAEVESTFGWQWLAQVTGKLTSKIAKERSEEECREKILAQPGPEHLIPVLKNTPLFLVIEDFHYLTPAVQKSVFQQWKSFVDEEVSVAVIGTTHHACDLAFANKDLIGRIRHLQMTTWTERDLSEIARKGFDVLNFVIDPKIISRIAQEAVGLPLLAQAICLELCLARELRETITERTQIPLSRPELFGILNEIALTTFGQFESMYERITRGLRNRRKKKYKTYEYLLSVFSMDPVVYKLRFPEIIDRLEKLPAPQETVPPQPVVKSSLTRLNQLQEKMGATLLEWHARDETLYILEPSFLFYLRWRKQRTTAPTIYDLFKDFVSDIQVKVKGNVTSVTLKYVGDNKEAKK